MGVGVRVGCSGFGVFLQPPRFLTAPGSRVSPPPKHQKPYATTGYGPRGRVNLRFPKPIPETRKQIRHEEVDSISCGAFHTLAACRSGMVRVRPMPHRRFGLVGVGTLLASLPGVYALVVDVPDSVSWGGDRTPSRFTARGVCVGCSRTGPGILRGLPHPRRVPLRHGASLLLYYSRA